MSYICIMIIEDSLNCDASFRTKGGKVMEWQVKDTLTGDLYFVSKIKGGSSNLAEFFAIIEAMMLQEKEGMNLPIYSDSRIAISWVNKQYCSTWSADTTEVKSLLDEYMEWLKTYGHNYEVIKWNTKEWGEIPSDFNRK